MISKKFKPVAEVVLHRLEAEIAAGTAKPSARDYVSAIKLYLIPFFYGLYNVDGINRHERCRRTWHCSALL